MQEMPQVLVWGQSGFVGAHVARALDARRYRVRAVWDHAEVADEEERARWGWTPRPGELPRHALDGCAAAIYVTPSPRRTPLAEGLAETRAFMDAALAHRASRGELLKLAAVCSGESVGAQGDATDYARPGAQEAARAALYVESELARYLIEDAPAALLVSGWLEGPGDLREEALVARAASGALELGDEALWIVDVRRAALAIVAALERGRPGRRFVLGGASLAAGAARNALGLEAPGRLDRLARRVGARLPHHAERAAPALALRALDASRAEQELDFAPGDPLAALEASVAWLKARRPR